MSNARPSKNERRDAAREKAREQRLKQQRREKRNRAVLQLSIGVVIVAIVAVVALVIVNSVRPAGPGPRNMANGGITISGASLKAIRTGPAAAGSTPSPQTPPAGKVLIQAWEDFGCPACRSFEEANGSTIAQLVKSGAAEVQYLPVSILDNRFQGGYSTRAANAAAAVANWSPDSFPAFHSLMYQKDVQPEEGQAGLTDDRLIELVQQVKPQNLAQIEKAIRGQQYVKWVDARTEEFTKDGGALAKVKFPSSREGASTPTVLVNGQFYDGTTSFGAFVTSVGGAYTASPTPSG